MAVTSHLSQRERVQVYDACRTPTRTPTEDWVGVAKMFHKAFLADPKPALLLARDTALRNARISKANSAR